MGREGLGTRLGRSGKGRPGNEAREKWEGKAWERG